MLNRKAWLKRQNLHNEKFHTKLKTKLGAKSSPLDSKPAKGPQMHRVLGKGERERERK